MRTIVVRILLTVFVLPLLWLVEPFWRIRITQMWCTRFGPLAFNTHLWVGNRTLEPEHRTLRLFYGWAPANHQLFEMWKRRLPILESRLLAALFNYGGKWLSGTRHFAPLPQEFWNYRALSVQPVLTFTTGEIERGQALSRSMGMAEDDWWVCIQARDAAFHNARGHGDSGTHRNCSIENYIPAAREISRRGGRALRMGALVDRPMPETGDPRIIDYATKHRSDFGDIYFLGRCRFFLGCGTGSESVPPLFDIPVAKANMLPLRPTPVGRRSLYIPKLIRRDGEVLPFMELQRLGAYVFDHYETCRKWELPGGIEAMGLAPEENAAEDVLGLCTDMFDLLDGIPPEDEAARLQAEFKRRFFGHFPDITLIPDLAPSFALKYRRLIEA